MTETTTTQELSVRSRMTVPTAHASRYMQQLCKHFAHKIPVDFDKTDGRMTFPQGGEAVLHASDTQLDVQLATGDEDGMARLQGAVVKHLKIYTFREELPFDWHPA